MPTPGRRSLRFACLNDVLHDVDQLLKGHTTVGQWSLSEICQHLAATMQLALRMPPTIQHDPSLKLSDERIREVFEAEALPEAMELPSVLPPPVVMADHEAADLLREAITRYTASDGPTAPHRFLGRLTREQWSHLQRIHCAHHLSFAIPDNP